MLKIKFFILRVLVGLDVIVGFGFSIIFCGGVFEICLVCLVIFLWDFLIKFRWREI